MNWYRRRKLAWLERCGLRDHEEWPLFGVKKYISESQRQVWVKLNALPDLEGRRDRIRFLLGEIRHLEHRLEKEGIVGWLQSIRKGNWRMRKWTEMIGAELYAETETHWHFRKQADVAHLPKTLKALVAQGGMYHGSA